MNENLPALRVTLPAIVATYWQAEQDIRTDYEMLHQAEQNLKAVFTDSSSRFRPFDDHNSESFDNPDRTMERLKQAAWKYLVDKMGIRSAMSIKRAQELDAQQSIYNPVEPFPEITGANILAMMETTYSQLGNFLTEAVQEVYDWLRPRRGYADHYKTNQRSAWAPTGKVIKDYMIELKYRGGFQVRYHSRKYLTALDNVFHLLDGKGIVKSHYGPLIDAIDAAKEGAGETDYFRFKCYLNGNLHLEFKRKDLLDKFKRQPAACASATNGRRQLEPLRQQPYGNLL